MAATDGPATDHLSFLKESAESARRFGFFALLRQAEGRGGTRPRIGRSLDPAQNIADLAHASSLDFPGATIAAIEMTRQGRARVRSCFLGLTGPMGPLPLHLTEYAHYERLYASSQPFGGFLDLLTDRMLQFFYRAWADSQPCAQADRPDDDRFARYVARLSGAVEGSFEERPDILSPTAMGAEPHSVPMLARLPYAGLYVSRRSASVIEDGLTRVLGATARVEEFVPRRRDLEAADQTRLGRASSTLGVDAIMGSSVAVADDTFRVILGCEDLDGVRRLLPGGVGHAAARRVLQALAPPHLDWEIALEIDQQRIEPARLDGRAQLGWLSWLTPRAEPAVRRDPRLRRVN